MKNIQIRKDEIKLLCVIVLYTVSQQPITRIFVYKMVLPVSLRFKTCHENFSLLKNKQTNKTKKKTQPNKQTNKQQQQQQKQTNIQTKTTAKRKQNKTFLSFANNKWIV